MSNICRNYNIKYKLFQMPTYPTYKLGEIIDKVPIEFKVKQKEYLPKGKFPVVDQGQDLIGGFVDDKSLLVKTELPVIVFGDHTKAKKFIDFPFVAGADGTKIIKPKKDYFIEPKLFYWFLHCVKFPDKGYARHFQYLLKSDIAVPPLATQHAIVTRIETLFAELDKAVQHLRTAQQQLKTYRQAVLKVAFEECDSYEKITNCFDVTGGLTKNSQREKFSIKMPYLRVANVYYNRLDLSEIKEIGVQESEIKDKLLKKEDLLFVEGNGSKEQIGRVAVWDGSIENCLHQNHIIKGRPLGTMLSKFALYYFISDFGREQILKVASSTSGLYTLSTEKVRNLKVPSCSLTEQHRIVQEIESRLSQATASETYIENALQQAEALRQSILKKAFGGELV